MKNRYIILLPLFVSTGLHSMESNVEQLPDLELEQDVFTSYYTNTFIPFFIKSLQEPKLSMRFLIERGEYIGLTETETKEIIKNFQDKDGNTLTHALITYGASKILHEFAQKELISFKKNKDNVDAFDTASTNFYKSLVQADENEEKENKEDDDAQFKLEEIRCSYFILSNYIKIKQGKHDDCIQCCYTHDLKSLL